MTGRNVGITLVILLVATVWYRLAEDDAGHGFTGDQAGEEDASDRRAKRRKGSSGWFGSDHGSTSESHTTSIYEGVVLDAQGAPAELAQVTAQGLGRSSQLRTQTDKGGGFSISLAHGARYTLKAERNGHKSGVLVVKGGDENAPSVLRLLPVERWRVRVRDGATGRTISSADLTLRGPRAHQEKTDESGTCEIDLLPPGGYTLEVQAEGYAGARRHVNATGREDTVEVEIAMVRAAHVSGVVLGPDGKPLPEARVSLVHAGVIGDEVSVVAVQQTSLDGRFELSGLAAGSYRLRAERTGLLTAETAEPLQVQTGETHADLVLRLSRGGVLSGTVRDETGRPVAEALVHAVPRSGGFGLVEAVGTKSDERGRYLLGGLRATEYRVRASQGQRASEQVVISMVEQADLNRDFVLDAEASIRGRVLSKGQPAEGATVLARWMEGTLSESYERTVVAGAGGAFTFDGLAPGKHKLVAMWSAGARLFPDKLEHELTALTGERDVKLELDEAATLRGNVRFADGSVPAHFEVMVSGQRATSPQDETGAFEATGLLPGKYVVSLRGDAFEPLSMADIELKSGDDTDLGEIVVERGHRVRGVVVDASGRPVAQAEVMVGNSWLADAGSVASAGTRGQATFKSTVTDSAGEFSLAGLGSKGLLLLAEHPQAGRSPLLAVSTLLAQTRPVVQLSAGARVSGQVTVDGTPKEGLLVSATIRPEGDRSTDIAFAATSDEHGRYQLRSLPPGNYLVLAALAGNQHAAQTTLERLTVKPTDTALTLDLTIQTGRVTVLVKPPAKGARASEAVLQGENGMHTGHLRSDDGLELKGVVPGRYQLCLQADRGARLDEEDPASCKFVQITERPSQTIQL